VALAWLVLLPATAAAHPLGNFTINHYAGLTIGQSSVDVDLVIDMAEIPAFQERQRMDSDADGSVSDEEGDAWAGTTCQTLAGTIHLDRDAQPQPAAVTSHTISFPGGAGGLSTLRLECRLTAALVPPLDAPATFTFADPSYAERIGWREIVVTADGTILDPHGLPATSPSQKLTAYPATMLTTPLDVRTATIAARPGPGGGTATPSPAQAVAVAAPGGAAVPGGVAGDLPPIFGEALSGDLSLIVALGALGAAFLIGAFHAITPGHGKTVMAAYLVGTRGSPAHAVGLGLSVAVSHTLGILALALVVVAAEGALPPDVIARTTPLIAAASIVVIGGLMLIGQLRQRVAARRSHDHDHDRAHDHGHQDGHDHGGGHHSHVPPAGASLTWRGLFALGLTGGLIPSASALVILLGSIVAGRTLLGLVLVVVFGLGMASVMSAVGLAMVFARGRLDRVPRSSRLSRIAMAVPLLASIAVIGIGVVLTWSAVVAQPAL
jgi:ABC-type nickel/cobalt efflux system permease component RcnA